MSKSVPIDLLRGAELKTDDDLINDILNDLDDSDTDSNYTPDSGLDYMSNDVHKQEHELPEHELPERELPERELPERELPERELPERELPERELPAQQLPGPQLTATQLTGNIESTLQPATHTFVSLYTQIIENLKPSIIVFILILFIYFNMYKNIIIVIQKNINVCNNNISIMLINALISSTLFIFLNMIA